MSLYVTCGVNHFPRQVVREVLDVCMLQAPSEEAEKYWQAEKEVLMNMVEDKDSSLQAHQEEVSSLQSQVTGLKVNLQVRKIKKLAEISFFLFIVYPRVTH